MASGRRQFIGAAVTGLVVSLIFTLLTAVSPVNLVVADPPADQEYVGNKRCASCHFKQYMSWKQSPHSKAFSLLTKKYETDAECLKCHTTGYGEPTGYKDAKSTPALQDVGCETCHGPGSKHEEICTPFANVKELTKEQEEAVRGSIWLMLPKNVCIECHKVQGHGKSSTPADLKKK